MIEFTTNNGEETAPEIMRTLDELAREGARRMIAAALEVEVAESARGKSVTRKVMRW